MYINYIMVKTYELFIVIGCCEEKEMNKENWNMVIDHCSGIYCLLLLLYNKLCDTFIVFLPSFIIWIYKMSFVKSYASCLWITLKTLLLDCCTYRYILKRKFYLYSFNLCYQCSGINQLYTTQKLLRITF